MEILFDKFLIQNCLKKTEFSAVYKAEHIFLKTQIVLKTLDISRAVDKTFLERFKREARILAGLEPPNIIRVLDFGEAGNIFYISFESLSYWIRRISARTNSFFFRKRRTPSQ